MVVDHRFIFHMLLNQRIQRKSKQVLLKMYLETKQNYVKIKHQKK